MSRTEVVVLVSLSTSFLWIVLQFFWNGWAPDLSAVYFAARSFSQEEFDIIYLAPPLFFGGTASEEWAMMASELGHPGEPALPYAYAPLWAALLSGVASRLDPIAFFNSSLALNAILLAAIILMVARILRLQGNQLKLFAVLSLLLVLIAVPYFTAFWLNQPHILLTFLVLFAFERFESGNSISAGVLLGFAAALKVFPAVFALVFIARGNWKAAASTILASIGLLAASFICAGTDLNIAFVDQLRRVGSATIMTPLNFSLEAWIHRAIDIWFEGTSTGANSKGFYISVRDPIYGIVARIGLVTSLGLVSWKCVRSSAKEFPTSHVLLAVWTAVTLFSPLAWSHYIIGALLLALGIVVSRPSACDIGLLGASAILLSHPVQRMVTTNTFEPIWLMTCGLISLVFLLILAVKAQQPRHPS